MSERMTIRQYVERQWARLEESLQQAMAVADVEAVHDLRVASRRLEEPLTVCRDWVNGKTLDRAIRQLRRLRQAFREVRDFDVLHKSLHDAKGLSTKQLDYLHRELAEARSARMHTVRRKAGTKQLASARALLDDLLEAFEASGGNDAQWVCDQLEALVQDRATEILQSDPAQDGRLDLHGTRIGLKRLRYATELTEAIAGTDRPELMSRLRDAQDRLGQWNDELQAARWVSGLARKRRVLIEQPMGSAALLKYAAARIEHAQGMARAFLEVWPELQAAIRAASAAE